MQIPLAWQFLPPTLSRFFMPLRQKSYAALEFLGDESEALLVGELGTAYGRLRPARKPRIVERQGVGSGQHASSIASSLPTFSSSVSAFRSPAKDLIVPVGRRVHAVRSPEEFEHVFVDDNIQI